MAGITKWFWDTIEGYLSYLLPKFEDFVPTSLGCGAIQTRRKCVTVTADYCNNPARETDWPFQSDTRHTPIPFPYHLVDLQKKAGEVVSPSIPSLSLPPAPMNQRHAQPQLHTQPAASHLPPAVEAALETP